ncbi:MAG TPA: hypothetical protein ENK14_09805 [Caldithrix sp.]|nr:hypothetical protein [Caldithrix sp.]
MNFRDFKNKFQSKPIIDSKDFYFFGNENYLKRQVSEWLKKGLLLKLKRGIYLINDANYLEKTSLLSIANYLYQPSYISLEFALRYYQLIPEEVYHITSVTTRKTAHFKNSLAYFYYRHIKESLFWGFDTISVNNQSVFMALPEKALIDFFYLNLNDFINQRNSWQSYRFQNIEKLNFNQLDEYLERIENKKLNILVESFKSTVLHQKFS